MQAWNQHIAALVFFHSGQKTDILSDKLIEASVSLHPAPVIVEAIDNRLQFIPVFIHEAYGLIYDEAQLFNVCLTVKIYLFKAVKQGVGQIHFKDITGYSYGIECLRGG